MSYPFGLDGGWLCNCGAWLDHDFHCDHCGAEPPWGCACCEDSEDEGRDDYDADDYFPGEYP